MPLSLALAQINPKPGALSANVAMIVQAARDCHAQGVELMVTPELALSGYDAQDLFLRDDFLLACEVALTELQTALAAFAGLTVIVGHPQKGDLRTTPQPTQDSALARCTQPLLADNCATVLQGGRRLACYRKQHLPNYRIYDEQRYFQTLQDAHPAGKQTPCVLALGAAQTPVGIVICEDLWGAHADALIADYVAAGAHVLVSLNASPWHQGKGHTREQYIAPLAQSHGITIAYANSVGAQDDLLFDGGSFVVDAKGQVVCRAQNFVSTLVQGDTRAPAPCPPAHGMDYSDAALAELWQALVLGLADYVRKNNFPGVVLGLSGGIDSALVLTLAVDALGAEAAHAVLLPSPYTAAMSLDDARDLAQRLGVRHDTIAIENAMTCLQTSLAPLFQGTTSDVTEENLQARIRGILLMALSNKFGRLLLTTGNKSEVACGYATLYGDMCGGFAPIADVYKTTVFALARWRNRHDPFQRGQQPIPERIITRPPSAELGPNQTDQDSLPAYAELDAILSAHIEQGLGSDAIVALGFARDTVQRVLQLVQRSEYKRSQAAIGTRVSAQSLGRDWRFPLTRG